MSLASSSTGPAFTSPEYFVRVPRSDKWSCKVCSPHRVGAKKMSSRTALQHEKSNVHAQYVADEHDPWKPQTDVRGWTETPLCAADIRAMKAREYIPFWMRGVEAAEKGEILSMEKFLDEAEWAKHSGPNTWGAQADPGDGWGAANTGWGVADDGWGAPDNGWGAAGDGWGDAVDKTVPLSSGHAKAFKAELTGNNVRGRGSTNRKRNASSKKGKQAARTAADPDPFAFVEDIARQEAVDAQRKRDMHQFFEMPTEDKVNKIQEAIKNLRTTT